MGIHRRIADVSGHIQVIRLSRPDSPIPSHIVRFLTDADSDGFPFRQFWGFRAIETILKQLQLDLTERAVVHAELEQYGVSAAIQKTLPDRLVKRLRLHTASR